MNSQTKLRFFQLLVFLVPAIVTYLTQIQGFNFLYDGLWLLGTRTIAQGGVLYRDFFSIYGPMKYFALWPFFLVLGESIRTLIVFKAIVNGTASILGFIVAKKFGGKRFAFIIPLAVMALGPIPLRYVCALAFSFLFSRTIGQKDQLALRGLFLGLSWGLLALFGLDMTVYGTIIIIVGALFSKAFNKKKPRSDLRSNLGVLLGFSSIIVITMGVAGALGTFETFLWDTVVCPLSDTPNHYRGPFFGGIFQPQAFGPVFSQTFTGEDLDPAWPGHTWHRAFAISLMLGLVFLAPILTFTIRRRISDPRLGPLAALALAGWTTVLWRNDLAHLEPAFFGTLLFLLCLLPTQISRPKILPIGFTLLAITLGPAAGENAWLITHRKRPALVTWDRSTAKNAMTRNRKNTLEGLLGLLGEDRNKPTIAWPAHPGLVFLSGNPFATRQITLLSGGVQNPESVIEDLKNSDPDLLIIGRWCGRLSSHPEPQKHQFHLPSRPSRKATTGIPSTRKKLNDARLSSSN